MVSFICSLPSLPQLVEHCIVKIVADHKSEKQICLINQKGSNVGQRGNSFVNERRGERNLAQDPPPIPEINCSWTVG